MTTALELHDRWVGASSKARRLELLLTRCLTDEFGITSKTLRSDIENELDSCEGRTMNDNPWREFIENCINGSNYFRVSEYMELLADLDRGYAAEARLQKIMARCADLLDEDQFNELDAIARTTDSASGVQK